MFLPSTCTDSHAHKQKNTTHLISWGGHLHSKYIGSYCDCVTASKCLRGYIRIRCMTSPFSKTTRNVCTCVCCSKCQIIFQPQWQKLRSPGCWRWKALCWTPWRTRFCRWMALRVVWCRSTQVRALWTQVSCAASAKALSWEAEAAAARPEVLPVWFWDSGSDTLETPAGMWVSEPWESVFIRTG